jgi:type III secretion system (T3SS) SseB-like protein
MDAVARSDTPAARERVYRSFLETDWMTPTAGVQQPNTRSLQLVATTDRTGGRSMLAFTDENALRLWRPNGSAYAIVHGAGLFKIARDSGFASITVNPGGPSGGLLFRREFEILAMGAVPDFAAAAPAAAFTLGSGTKVRVVGPAVLPDALVATLRETLAGAQEVKGARAAMLAAGEDAPQPTIAVEVASGTGEAARSRIAAAVGAAVQKGLADGRSVDMLFVEPGEELAAAFAAVAPFYRRR